MCSTISFISPNNVHLICIYVSYICCIATIQLYVYIYKYIRYIIKHNDNFNERTHFFIKISLSHFILESVDVGCVWEVSWRRGQPATYWPKFFWPSQHFFLILAGVAQPWVTEGLKPSVCRWLSLRHLVPNRLQLQLTQAVYVLVIFLFDLHLLSLFFLLFTQVHLLIDGTVEG